MIVCDMVAFKSVDRVFALNGRSTVSDIKYIARYMHRPNTCNLSCFCNIL